MNITDIHMYKRKQPKEILKVPKIFDDIILLYQLNYINKILPKTIDSDFYRKSLSNFGAY